MNESHSAAARRRARFAMTESHPPLRRFWDTLVPVAMSLQGMSNTRLTNQRVVLSFAAVGLLAACAQWPTPPGPTPQATANEAEAPRAPVPGPPAPVATQQQATRMAMAAAGLLESGHE